MSSNAHARDCEGAAGAEMPQCGNARGDGEGGASSGQCNSDSGIELESSSIAAAGLFDAFEGAGSVAEAAAAEATAGEAAAEAAAEEAAARLVGGFAPLVAAAAGLALRAEEAAGRLRSLDTTGILAYASATGTLEKTKAYNKTQANYNYKTVLVMRIQWLRAVRMRGSEDARCFAKKRGSSLSGAHAMTYVRCSRVGARPPACCPATKQRSSLSGGNGCPSVYGAAHAALLYVWVVVCMATVHLRARWGGGEVWLRCSSNSKENGRHGRACVPKGGQLLNANTWLSWTPLVAN